ncbi:MAG: hypothetical protein ABSA18_12415 [Dehalococcoidia bacterium]
MKHLFKSQRGMTGLETAIILITFVTVAAVFGYAVLSAGLFAAERSKETHYAGLNEARSNLELSGSVMAKSDDETNVRSVLFVVKNAIAGNPVDMTPCNGTSNATNKCVISLTTPNDYINNVKWSKVAIGADNGNDLLETGEQFEITVDLTDLGIAGSLSENLTANEKFSLQVKPAVGSTITIQRQLPPAITPVMDLDLMTGFGGGSGGSTGGGNISLVLVPGSLQTQQAVGNYVNYIIFSVETQTNPIDMTPNFDLTAGQNKCVINLTTPGGTFNDVEWFYTPVGADNGNYLLESGERFSISLDLDQVVYPTGAALSPALHSGDAFTITVKPQGGSTLTIQGQAQ